MLNVSIFFKTIILAVNKVKIQNKKKTFNDEKKKFFLRQNIQNKMGIFNKIINKM